MGAAELTLRHFAHIRWWLWVQGFEGLSLCKEQGAEGEEDPRPGKGPGPTGDSPSPSGRPLPTPSHHPAQDLFWQRLLFYHPEKRQGSYFTDEEMECRRSAEQRAG